MWDFRLVSFYLYSEKLCSLCPKGLISVQALLFTIHHSKMAQEGSFLYFNVHVCLRACMCTSWPLVNVCCEFCSGHLLVFLFLFQNLLIQFGVRSSQASRGSKHGFKGIAHPKIKTTFVIWLVVLSTHLHCFGVSCSIWEILAAFSPI